MSDKIKYVLHCNNCPHKIFSTGADLGGLVEVKTVGLQRHLPIYDPNIKKTIVQTNKTRNKMFRCPKCGHTLRPFNIIKEEINEQTDRTD